MRPPRTGSIPNWRIPAEMPGELTGAEKMSNRESFRGRAARPAALRHWEHHRECAGWALFDEDATSSAKPSSLSTS